MLNNTLKMCTLKLGYFREGGAKQRRRASVASECQKAVIKMLKKIPGKKISILTFPDFDCSYK